VQQKRRTFVFVGPQFDVKRMDFSISHIKHIALSNQQMPMSSPEAELYISYYVQSILQFV